MTRTQLFLALAALFGPCTGDPGPDVTVCHHGSPLTVPEFASIHHLDHGDTLVEPETCDGVDQDCDGAVDDGASDASLWFLDHDADGFGDASLVVAACQAPPSHVGDGSDCDDADPGVYPGAPEVCDGADHDCDGLPTLCEGDGTFVLGGRLSFGGPLSTNASLVTFRSLIAADQVVDLGPLDGATLADVDLLFVNAWEAPPTGPEIDAVVAWVEEGGTLLLNAAGGYGGNSDGWVAPWSMATTELPSYSGTWPLAVPLHPDSLALVAGLSTFTNTTATPVYPLTGEWSDGGVEVLSSAGSAVLVHVPAAGEGQVLVVTNFWAFLDGGHVLEPDNATLVQRLAQSARDGG